MQLVPLHYGRWEMRATFGDGRPFYGPLKDAPGPEVDGPEVGLYR
jgi:hypothetical protein